MSLRCAVSLAAVACTQAIVLPYGRAGSVHQLPPSRTALLVMGETVDGKALVGANGELLDCIAQAVNGKEIEECEMNYTAAFDDATAADSQPSPVAHTGQERKVTSTSTVDGEKLVGANGELLDCIAQAENGQEIEECELSYTTTFNESTGQ